MVVRDLAIYHGKFTSLGVRPHPFDPHSLDHSSLVSFTCSATTPTTCSAFPSKLPFSDSSFSQHVCDRAAQLACRIGEPVNEHFAVEHSAV